MSQSCEITLCKHFGECIVHAWWTICVQHVYRSFILCTWSRDSIKPLFAISTHAKLNSPSKCLVTAYLGFTITNVGHTDMVIWGMNEERPSKYQIVTFTGRYIVRYCIRMQMSLTSKCQHYLPVVRSVPVSVACPFLYSLYTCFHIRAYGQQMDTLLWHVP